MNRVGEVLIATDFPQFDGIAACAETDPEAWFPEANQSGFAAKKICQRCGCIDQCLEWALRNGEPYGVWGGLSAEQRSQLRRRGAA